MNIIKWLITILMVFIAIVPSFYFLGHLRDVNAHDSQNSGSTMTINEGIVINPTDSTELQIIREPESQLTGVFEHSY